MEAASNQNYCPKGSNQLVTYYIRVALPVAVDNTVYELTAPVDFPLLALLVVDGGKQFKIAQKPNMPSAIAGTYLTFPFNIFLGNASSPV